MIEYRNPYWQKKNIIILQSSPIQHLLGEHFKRRHKTSREDRSHLAGIDLMFVPESNSRPKQLKIKYACHLKFHIWSSFGIYYVSKENY